MPLETARFGLPYPAPTGDPVDVAGDMQRLAAGLAARLPFVLTAPANVSADYPAGGLERGIISSVTIPDPGAPYRVVPSGFARAYSEGTSGWDLTARFGPAATGSIRITEPVRLPSLTYGAVYMAAYPTPVLTGLQVIWFILTRNTSVGASAAAHVSTSEQSWMVEVFPVPTLA